MFAAILHEFIFASLACTSPYGCLSCGIMEKLAKLKLGKGQAGAASQFSRGYKTWSEQNSDLVLFRGGV